VVFRTIGIYVITSTFFTFFTFFQNPKSHDFLRFFCHVSYVFSNYEYMDMLKGFRYIRFPLPVSECNDLEYCVFTSMMSWSHVASSMTSPIDAP